MEHNKEQCCERCRGELLTSYGISGMAGGFGPCRAAYTCPCHQPTPQVEFKKFDKEVDALVSKTSFGESFPTPQSKEMERLNVLLEHALKHSVLCLETLTLGQNCVCYLKIIKQFITENYRPVSEIIAVIDKVFDEESAKAFGTYAVSNLRQSLKSTLSI